MSEEPSVFTKIINRELPADIVFENENIIVIKNIHPQAPVHLLGITKQPFSSLDALVQSGKEQQELLWELFHTLSTVAHNLGVAEKGYRLQANNGPEAGQTVFHLHVHLLAGKQLAE